MKVKTSDTDAEDEGEFYEDKIKLRPKNYKTKTHNILVSSLHRNWFRQDSSTFNFQIKFNASYGSVEKKIYTGEFQENVNIQS